MRRPDAALTQLRKSHRLHAGQWLGRGGEWPLTISLSVPGERKAMQDWQAFQAWRDAWRRWSGAGEVIWGERRWPALGRQAVPECWQLVDAAAVADALSETERWQRTEQRFAAAIGMWPALAPYLRARRDWLGDCADVEWRRLCDMLAWLDAHPESGLFVRQLPVTGIDSKWLEAHAGRLTDWLRLTRPEQAQAGFWALSGLRPEPDRLRLRLLDPALRARIGGLEDIQAPLDELAHLDMPAPRVIIVENKQTGLAFGDLPGSVLILARGYAIDRLHTLPWVRAAEHVDYWGDIDTHGLAILGRLRGHLPQVRSRLMDEATLRAHKPLWVTEPKPHNADRIDHLTDTEQALYADLKRDRFGVRVRLEQERIDWSQAWRLLTETR
jgi:hypothetical protein